MKTKGTTTVNPMPSSRGGDEFIAEIFKSIGFESTDDESYNVLAEYVDQTGERTCVHRGDATLHGRCWKLGGGLEVWAVLYEGPSEIYYADCRPAFRSRYVETIEPWELTEFSEDGEALVQGKSKCGRDVVFELQNLTEVRNTSTRGPALRVGLAGLASSLHLDTPRTQEALLSGASRPSQFEPAASIRDYGEDACENDYLVSGSILAWRELSNPSTHAKLVWLYVDAGEIRIEVIANRKAIRGRLQAGLSVTGRIWLQGHILAEPEVAARYEGLDTESLKSDFWGLLRRGN